MDFKLYVNKVDEVHISTIETNKVDLSGSYSGLVLNTSTLVGGKIAKDFKKRVKKIKEFIQKTEVWLVVF